MFVTDDFLALVVANQWRLPSTLFLDFLVGRSFPAAMEPFSKECHRCTSSYPKI